MIIKAEERREIVKEKFLGGEGEFHVKPIITTEQFEPVGRMCGEAFLTLGSRTGEHTHHGDCEVICFTAGEGIVVDDGVEIPVRAGDVNVTHDGHTHYLVNTGKEDLRFVTVIYYEK